METTKNYEEIANGMSPFIACKKDIGILKNGDILKYHGKEGYYYTVGFERVYPSIKADLDMNMIDSMGGDNFFNEHFTTEIDFTPLEQIVIDFFKLEIPIDRLKEYFIILHLSRHHEAFDSQWGRESRKEADIDINRWYGEYLTYVCQSISNVIKSN